MFTYTDPVLAKFVHILTILRKVIKAGFIGNKGNGKFAILNK